jgi:hypothetical protein
MNRTTNFIVIKTADLGQLLPVHFNEKYGKINPVTEVKEPRTWQELLDNEAYQLGHGGFHQFDFEGTPVTVVSLSLDPLNGDFSNTAAFAYGQGLIAPFGEVMSWQKAKIFIESNQSQEP